MDSDHEQQLAEVRGLAAAAERALDNARIDRPDLINHYTGIRNEWRALANEMAGRSS